VPRGSITDEFVSNAEVPPFEKLKLDEGEKARLAIPDMDLLWIEWVHTMRAPVLDEAGQPIATQTAGKGGKVRAGWSTDFVGAFKCFGRDEVLRKDRIDPGLCPGCEAASRGVRDMEPERRFALPVIRYATASKSSTQLRQPPGAEILIWTLTQKMYDKLMDQRPAIRDLLEIPEGQEVTLKQADIVILCESKDFQRMTFQAPMRPAWRDSRVAPVIRELWGHAENRPTDDQLLHAVVKPKERRWAEADVEDHEARWAAADRARAGGAPAAGTAAGPVSGEQVLDNGLDGLMDDIGSAGAADPGQDPFAGNDSAVPPPPAPSADDPFADPPTAGGRGGLDEFAQQQPAGQAAPATTSPAAGAGDQADPFADAPPAPAAAPNGSGGGTGSKSFDEVFAAAEAE
jgi:hypothetical protein